MICKKTSWKRLQVSVSNWVWKNAYTMYIYPTFTKNAYTMYIYIYPTFIFFIITAVNSLWKFLSKIVIRFFFITERISLKKLPTMPLGANFIAIFKFVFFYKLHLIYSFRILCSDLYNILYTCLKSYMN